jgi:PST family polysaccharide transporter
MSIVKKGIGGVFWNVLGAIFQILLQLGVIAVLSRLLTPEDFGIVAFLLVLVSFSDLFTNMGIGSAIIQLPELNKTHIGLGYTYSTIIGLLVGGLFAATTPYISGFFKMDNLSKELYFFACFFPVKSFNSMSISLLTREMRYKVVVQIGILSYTIGMGLTAIILAYLDFGYWSLILGQFVSLLLSFILLFLSVKPTFNLLIFKDESRKLLFFGTGHTLATVLNYLADNLDNLVVSRFMGAVSLGYYSKAFQILNVPYKFLGNIFERVLFPVIAKKQDNLNALSKFYLFSSSFCFGLLFPVTVFVFINAALIVDTLLGNQWAEVVLPLRILIVLLTFRFGNKINRTYLKSIGLVYSAAGYQFLFVLYMTFGCIAGAKYAGISGVAIGVLLATLINYVHLSVVLCSRLGFSLIDLILIHVKYFILNVPFLILFLGLEFYVNYSSMTIFLLSMFYVLFSIISFFHYKYIIFNSNNKDFWLQIFPNIPKGIFKIVRKIPSISRYYAS